MLRAHPSLPQEGQLLSGEKKREKQSLLTNNAAITLNPTRERLLTNLLDVRNELEVQHSWFCGRGQFPAPPHLADAVQRHSTPTQRGYVTFGTSRRLERCSYNSCW